MRRRRLLRVGPAADPSGIQGRQPGRPTPPLEQLVDEVYAEATSRGRVLVFVAHPVLRVAISGLLREAEYSVREVRDLPEAIYRADLEPPDVVLMDVPRGWGDARYAVRVFRVLHSTTHIPILAVIPAPQRGLERLFDGVLAMPFSARQLLARVERLMSRDSNVQPEWGGAA